MGDREHAIMVEKLMRLPLRPLSRPTLQEAQEAFDLACALQAQAEEKLAAAQEATRKAEAALRVTRWIEKV
jgi:hypothetical protein